MKTPKEKMITIGKKNYSIAEVVFFSILYKFVALGSFAWGIWAIKGMGFTFIFTSLVFLYVSTTFDKAVRIALKQKKFLEILKRSTYASENNNESIEDTYYNQ